MVSEQRSIAAVLDVPAGASRTVRKRTANDDAYLSLIEFNEQDTQVGDVYVDLKIDRASEGGISRPYTVPDEGDTGALDHVNDDNALPVPTGTPGRILALTELGRDDELVYEVTNNGASAAHVRITAGVAGTLELAAQRG